jgi:hypothetical protein
MTLRQMKRNERWMVGFKIDWGSFAMSGICGSRKWREMNHSGPGSWSNLVSTRVSREGVTSLLEFLHNLRLALEQ